MFFPAPLPLLALLLVLGFHPAPAAPTFQGAQPQLAAQGDRVYLAFGQDDTISVARSDDGGETFAAPTRVPVSGRVALGMHRGPRVAATNSTVLVTAVAGVKGGGADGDVLLFRSKDSGASWSAPVTINAVAGSAREGIQTMAASPSGLVVVAWLDLRAGAPRIFAAVSRDHGTTWAPNALVYASPGGGVCECCHPSVAIGRDGRITVMFRNNVDGHRDMYAVQSDAKGAFGHATKLGTGSWLLNGCPMDGGGLTSADDGVTAVWRREDAIFVSGLQGTERRVGTGRDSAIASAGANVDIVWASSTGIMLMRNSTEAVLVAPGKFPSVLALKDKTLVAWEDRGTSMVRAVPR